jgi:hypothetical protein
MELKGIEITKHFADRKSKNYLKELQIIFR